MAKKKNKPAKQFVQVDIVSDIVCPWCWLGSEYFFKARQQSPHAVELIWRPYMLDPTVPAEGADYKAYMKAKFGGGSSDRFKAMRTHLEEAAPDAGIAFKFDQLTVRPNTLNAHRLIKWAQGQGKGDQAARLLFKAYFDELIDIGDRDALAGLAENIGMDAALVAELLASDSDVKAVEEEILFFRNLGVSGVPTFIYNGQFIVQGAQPIDNHLQAIDKAATMPIEPA